MKVTALAGGIGASKFLLGLQSEMPPDDLTVIANTGDDIELFGLRVCPDIDTIAYTLAGLVNGATGWGIQGDTFECLTSLARLGEPNWFNIGDRDLATHLYRTKQIQLGSSLTQVTAKICTALRIRPTILPMSDNYTPTIVATDEGEMHLQEYFVRRKCEPVVQKLTFKDIENSRASVEVEHAIREADVVIICPSNPAISIGPILSVPGIRPALENTRAKVVAVTPIVKGRALKGPTVKMLAELGDEATALGVASLYSDFLNIFVMDSEDYDLKEQVEALGAEVVLADTVMNTFEDKRRLASEVLEFVFNRQ